MNITKEDSDDEEVEARKKEIFAVVFENPSKNSKVESESKRDKYSTSFSHREVCTMTITYFRPAKKDPSKRTILIQAKEQNKHLLSLL